jgi:DNA-binding NarL/FixJ family response regulator
MNEYRIILADDHSLFREGVKSLLSQSSDLKIVAEVRNGKDLLSRLKSVECDLIVMDIAMPEMDGLTALIEVKRIYPKLKVLMMSMLNDFSHFDQAKAHGASGYISKDDAGDELLRGIAAVRKGKMFVSPTIMTLLGERQLHLLDDGKSPSVEILTKRERQILELIVRGMTNKNIAGKLGISIHTVENHRAHVFEKLGFKSVASLVKFAIEKGLL